ncbi:MAG: hypothetical protein OXF02_02305 [Simkaniaceae bacterium]|nr:hypothetical protein [Simkaniaceae bacterium]
MSAVGEWRGLVWLMGEKAGTAVWLCKVPGGPPLRFDPLPEGVRQRKCTEEEKRAVVDYALEVRKKKLAGKCAEEVGICTTTLSNWIKAECATYRAFSCLGLDNRTLRTVDYRELLADLREGKTSIRISDYTKVNKRSDQFPISELSCEGVGATASAIDERQGVVRPVSGYVDAVVWFHKVPGSPPLWFRSPPKGFRQRDYTEPEKRAVVDYALEVRETKSMSTCAKETGIHVASLSNWVKWGCEAYQVFSDLHLDADTLRVIDYRKLLADLRSGIESVTVSDYTEGSKYSTRQSTRGMKVEKVPAQEEIRDGHPYFLSPGKGKRRVFTEEQKAKVIDYWFDEFDGESLSTCARKCNLWRRTLIEWMDERDSKGASQEDTTELSESSPEETASDPVEGPLPRIIKRKRYAKGDRGMATWLHKVPGGPPLRFPPVPGGRQHKRLTKEERDAVIDYVLEVRKTKIIKKCAEEMGLTTAIISYHVRAECKNNETFLNLGLNDQDLWGVDYRALLADLRAGKCSIRIADYNRECLANLRAGKSSSHIADYNQGRLQGTERMSMQAKECTRDGHPYLASADEGEESVFAEEQRERIASYRSHELMEGAVSGGSRERNLGEQTLIDLFDDTYGCTSERLCPDTTGLPESPPEVTAFYPDEGPLPRIPWQEVAGLCGDTPVES